ncbi:hypothetical protein YC2023_071031 [Brassica napus]
MVRAMALVELQLCKSTGAVDSVRSPKDKSSPIHCDRERSLTFLSYKKKRFKRKKSETHRMVSM